MKRTDFLLYYILLIFVLVAYMLKDLSRQEAILIWILLDVHYIMKRLYDK